MFARTIVLIAMLGAATCDETNLVDTFVGALTGTTREEAESLVGLLDKCTAGTGDLFQEQLKVGINATRTCTKQASRDSAKQCINQLVSLTHLTWSPYNIFATQKLTPTEIAILETCEAGLSTDAEIIASFEVITKRFLQCHVDIVSGTVAYDTVLDIFKGTEQTKELNRAQLTNICGALHFSGETHKEAVDSVSVALKNYLFLLPSRRNLAQRNA